MKRMLLLLPLYLLAASSLFAQGKAIIKGKVQKSLSDEVIIATLPSPLVPEEKQISASLEKGNFVLEIPLEEASVLELVHGDESVPLYLEPGFDLTLSFTGGKMQKTLSFGGQGANENDYLLQHTTRFDEEEDYQVLPDNIKLTEAEFLEFLAYRKEDQLRQLDKRTAAKPVSEDFRKFILAEIAFSYANDRITFFDLREKMRLNQRLTPSASYYDFLNELDMQQSASLRSISFPAFLRHYIVHQAKLENLIPTDRHYFRDTYELVSRQLSGQARTMAQAQVIRQSLQQGNVLHVPAMLQDFERSKANPAVHASLLKQYQNHKGLGIGSAAPAFSLRDISGDTVSLSDFRGKIVYLSFWRTDCGPCLVEQPHAQELIRKLQGHAVAIVNINVDEHEATWRRTVETRGLDGVQLYLQGRESELARQYGLKDLPAYFLIDEAGYLISTRPRRPIDRELEKEILQHVTGSRASSR